MEYLSFSSSDHEKAINSIWSELFQEYSYLYFIFLVWKGQQQNNTGSRSVTDSGTHIVVPQLTTKRRLPSNHSGSNLWVEYAVIETMGRSLLPAKWSTVYKEICSISPCVCGMLCDILFYSYSPSHYKSEESVADMVISVSCEDMLAAHDCRYY